MMAKVFNASQQMIAKHLYAIVSGMSEEQVAGAVMALTTLGVIVEDGYLSINKSSLEVDFYTHCYDALLGSSLALKMLQDDGLIKNSVEKTVRSADPATHLKEADLALSRVEALIQTLARGSETSQ